MSVFFFFCSWGLGLGLFFVLLVCCFVHCCSLCRVVSVLAVVLFVWMLLVCLLLFVVGLVCCIEATKTHKQRLLLLVWCVCLLFLFVLCCLCFSCGFCLGVFSLLLGSWFVRCVCVALWCGGWFVCVDVVSMDVVRCCWNGVLYRNNESTTNKVWLLLLVWFVCILCCVCVLSFVCLCSWGLCFGVGLFVVGMLYCSWFGVVLCCGVVCVVFVLLLVWLLLVVVGLGCCVEATKSPHKNKLVVVVGLICSSLALFCVLFELLPFCVVIGVCVWRVFFVVWMCYVVVVFCVC